MKVVRLLPILASAALFAGCGEPVSPPGTPVRPPSLTVYDGAHGGGNPGFFFLPPLVPSPSGDREFGDAPLAIVEPVVRICTLASDPSLGSTTCAADVVTFSGDQVKLSTSLREYSVNWDTKAYDLSTSSFYRISVYVGTQMLGFADVDPVTSQEMRNPRTKETFQLLDGRTLPIKFTIEEDGLCAGSGECTVARVTNDGGSFTLPSGNGGIYLPEGWLPSPLTEVSMTLQRVPTAADNDCLEKGYTGPGLIRQYEGCMQITTVPDLTGTAGIQQPAVVGLCIEIPSTDPDYDNAQLIKSDAGRPIQPLDDANPIVIVGFTCEGFTGTEPEPVTGSFGGHLRHLASTTWRQGTRQLGRMLSVQPLYAIDLGVGGGLEIGSDFSHFGWGIQGTMSAAGPTTVNIPVNGYTTLSTRVEANHVHAGSESGAALQNIPVTFTITSTTGGQLAEAGGRSYSTGPVTVLTNENGEAHVDFRAGDTPAVYTIQATANALGSPVTFTVISESVTIGFETWPSEGSCSPSCLLATQYAPTAFFSFAANTASTAGYSPLRTEGGPYYPVANHSATGPSEMGGTLSITLGGYPPQTTFRIRYSPTGVTPQFTAYLYDPEGGAVPVSNAVSYTIIDLASSGAPAREAALTVSIPEGRYRVDIGGTTSTSAI